MCVCLFLFTFLNNAMFPWCSDLKKDKKKKTQQAWLVELTAILSILHGLQAWLRVGYDQSMDQSDHIVNCPCEQENLTSQFEAIKSDWQEQLTTIVSVQKHKSDPYTGHWPLHVTVSVQLFHGF